MESHVTIDTLTLLKKDISSLINVYDHGIKQQLDEFMQKLQSSENELEKLKKLYSDTCIKAEENDKLILQKNYQIASLELKITELEKMVVHLEEENKTFQKVSSIIQYDKENAKLRTQVAQLEKRIETLLSKEQEPSKITTVPTEKLSTNQIQTDDHLVKDDEHQDESTCGSDDNEDDNDIEVYEQKINKIIYYVTDDDQKKIFEKKENGDIGEELGRLELVNGKLKPKWN